MCERKNKNVILSLSLPPHIQKGALLLIYFKGVIFCIYVNFHIYLGVVAQLNRFSKKCTSSKFLRTTKAYILP